MLLTIPVILGIRLEFILFALTLGGVALFHKRTMEVAISGLAVLLILKLFFDPVFDFYHHLFGEGDILQQILNKEMRQGEWPILLNLFGLLLGFSILAKLFEESKIPDTLPAILPNDWKGAFVLLVMIFVLSTFLDNIAAAMIGGAIALVVFKGKVHIGYVAGIIAASNAGGAGSVIGDTTTTLMWIDGVSPLDVLHGFVASITALVIFGIPASLQQDKFQKIRKDAPKGVKIQYRKLILVALILVSTILTNFYFDFPAIGVWLALLMGMILTSVPWKEAKLAMKGSIFLMALVTCASLMPVEELPPASVWTAFAYGFVSAIFDNIPLTKLCLDQGGYDWGVLAYSVGFGGSMIWFGSSAGVAISGIFPETRNTIDYVKKAWHIPIAYVAGFAMLILVLGWHPHANHNVKQEKEPIIQQDH
jgi:Na+/H+ antiporter NhaD/arsenite permease-like protein